MRVIITDTVFILNHDNPALEVFKDVLLVVCLEGKAVTDKYECFVSPYKQVGMENDKIGVDDQRYKALESVTDDLNRKLRYHDDILFLTDGNPESLYPFYVIKDRNEFNSLHLCTVSPWNFEGKRRIQGHKDMLSDLSKLTSILYINSNKYLLNLEKDATMKDVMQKLEADYAALLPTVVNSIGELYGGYYFDFASNTYVAIEEGFNGIDLSKKNQLDTEFKAELHRNFCTLGLIMSPDYPEEDDGTKKEIERVPARIDGKKICEYLRNQRIELAKANGIEFESEECPSIGPCAGTCAKCDQESEYLRDKLEAIPAADRVIPDFKLTEWEVEA